MNIFTIAINRRFADELAMGVLAQYGGDPLALADVLILLCLLYTSDAADE